MNIMKRLITTAALLLLTATFTMASAKDLSQAELQQLMNQNANFVLLDVREIKEYNAGYIKDAVNSPLSTLQDDLDVLDAEKHSHIIVYCRTGRRAAKAMEILELNGYTNLQHLHGDINGWKANGLPLSRVE